MSAGEGNGRGYRNGGEDGAKTFRTTKQIRGMAGMAGMADKKKKKKRRGVGRCARIVKADFVRLSFVVVYDDG